MDYLSVAITSAVLAWAVCTWLYTRFWVRRVKHIQAVWSGHCRAQRRAFALALQHIEGAAERKG